MTSTPLTELARRARVAARGLALEETATKNEALELAASSIEAAEEDVLAANQRDLDRAESAGASETVLDRLRLDARRVGAMAVGLRAIGELPDPIGEIVSGSLRPNGLSVRRVRVPLGVVGVVYENRPNVTADAAGLCLKSSNAVILRGSAGAIDSNRAITRALRSGIEKAGLDPNAITLCEDVTHEGVEEFITLSPLIDMIVPRGGHELVSLVRTRSTIPYVIDGDGNCHVYVDASADVEMATKIVVNAKTQRPSVCNAMETLLVHRSIATELLLSLQEPLAGVELVGDDEARRVLPGIGEATEEDYATEYLSLKMAIAVVEDLDSALAHIARYSTGHSEAIVTNDYAVARRFCREVDAAAVLVNASTRFVDGGELGLGAEIGISTQKLHARGPMGLEALTSVKYVIEGNGHIRT